jgi:signal transduction histidine kinase
MKRFEYFPSDLTLPLDDIVIEPLPADCLRCRDDIAKKLSARNSHLESALSFSTHDLCNFATGVEFQLRDWITSLESFAQSSIYAHATPGEQHYLSQLQSIRSGLMVLSHSFSTFIESQKCITDISLHAKPRIHSCSYAELLRLSAITASMYPSVDYIEQVDQSLEPLIQTDGPRLSRCLMNLVQNGCDAITQSGQVKLTVRKTVPDFFESYSHQRFICSDSFDTSKEYILFQVSDSGVGMNPNQVFQLFNKGLSSKKSGSGIGLYSVAVFCSSLGGAIGVDSALSVGTTMSLYVASQNISAVEVQK